MADFFHILPQLMLDGLVLGFVYAVVAVGYTMVYGVLEFINFAHGDIFMVGAFIGTELFIRLGVGPNAHVNPWLALVTALVVAAVVTAALGVIIERIAYRPLRNAPRLIPLISAIGMSFVLEDLVRMIEGLHRGTFLLPVPTLFQQTYRFLASTANPQGLIIRFNSFVVIAAAIVMMVGLSWFVGYTRPGRAMRAVAQDRITASLQGINVDGIISLTFLVGSAMGGAGGVLYATQYGLVTPYIGFLLGMKAFTAAVVGGIGNIPGSFVGGILLGVLEQVGGGLVGTKFQNVFAFAILVFVLIFKPSGILGQHVQEKV